MSRYNNWVTPTSEDATWFCQTSTCSRRNVDHVPLPKLWGLVLTWWSTYFNPSRGESSSMAGSRTPSTSKVSSTPKATLTPTSSECLDAMLCMLLAFMACCRHAAIKRVFVRSSSTTRIMNSSKSTSRSGSLIALVLAETTVVVAVTTRLSVPPLSWLLKCVREGLTGKLLSEAINLEGNRGWLSPCALNFLKHWCSSSLVM
mmetsp:Transcript_116525/g.325971  ORF Transcript_116525/g.325971 Transcript_116525/m.325971 type:complete len:202 (-) Transcript_116525:1107-1712(-)